MRIEDSETVANYYQALVERRPDYAGVFFVGVKTTSIFCIATCRARKPKPENVEFFTEMKDALDAGYRPCKVCRPTENAGEAPASVNRALALVRDNPKRKITDAELREQGIAPATLRRWFKQHYGMTFQAYQRMFRINNAYTELRQGQTTTNAALDAGYESLSGFAYTFRKLTGDSPGQAKGRAPIVINRLSTPLGPMFACATERGICLLEFVDRRMLETEFRDLQRLLKTGIVAGDNDHLRQLRRELQQYFDGERASFDVALDCPGTEFQQAVWSALQAIPCGATASYGDQALRIGKPAAVRAVARANGANRVSILVPCHRVVSKDGSLTGYGGGLPRKRWLLEHESRIMGGRTDRLSFAESGNETGDRQQKLL